MSISPTCAGSCSSTASRHRAGHGDRGFRRYAPPDGLRRERPRSRIGATAGGVRRADGTHRSQPYPPRLRPEPEVAVGLCAEGSAPRLEDGGAYALLGPSGCGKTTLLNIISGLLQPSEGELLFDGKDVTNLSTQERNIAQVFQFPVIYDTMTVYDNLAFPLRNRRVPEAEVDRRVREILEMIGLADRAKRQAQGPDRRPEAEDLARPRPGALRRQRHPVRRAADRHRSAHEMGAALAAEAAAQALRLHHGLRHPRPDRGAHLRRQGRRHV